MCGKRQHRCSNFKCTNLCKIAERDWGETFIRGVIIEGLSTSGKASVFTALKRAQSQILHAEKTLIAVSEHYSQVLHSDHGVLRSLKQEEHMELLNRHVDYIEQLYTWIDSLGHMKMSHGVFYVLERFHLNHRHAFGDSPGIQTLEQRMAKLNARLRTSHSVTRSSRVAVYRKPWTGLEIVCYEGRFVSCRNL